MGREKRNHKVVYNGQSDLDKVLKEVPKKIKVITVYSLVEAYKINGSLARRTIRELLKRGTIKTVLKSAHLGIYTKSAKAAKEHKKKERKERNPRKIRSNPIFSFKTLTLLSIYKIYV